MANGRTSPVMQPRAQAEDFRGEAQPAGFLLWGAIITLVVIAHFALA